MKKYQLISIAMGIYLLVMPTLASAQDRSQNPPLRPTLMGRGADNSDGQGGSILGRPTIMPLRYDDNRRPPMFGTSTMDGRPMRFGSSTDMLGRPSRFGSSTMPFERRGEFGSSTNPGNRPGQERKELRLDIFKLRQENVVQQLGRAIDNLKQIRSRIDARITKSEGAGRDMTTARTLLATADAKIAAAEAAVNTVGSFVPPSSTSTPPDMSTSSENAEGSGDMANLDRPRAIADSAIKAIKDARDALNDVVTSIAHSLGLGLGEENNNPRATSTATTTNQ